MRLQYFINGITTYYNLLKARMLKVEVGSKARFCGSISWKIDNPCTCKIGKGFIITGGYGINSISPTEGSCIQVREGSTLSIGDYCGFSSTCISCHEKISIGNYVTIGAGTLINDSNDHCIDNLERRKERGVGGVARRLLNIKNKPITIEDDVFIGARCIINKGVTIGARSIIAAGSVVACNIPSDQIWGGNPAKFIKELK